MAAEPRIKPPSGSPSTNGRADCALAGTASRTDCQSILRQNVSTSLADNCSAGNELNWLNTIVEQFEGRLVRYAMRITGNLERGRDVVQETFLRLCREPAVATSDCLPQWLFTVCRRLAIDVRRKETRMSTQLENAAVCDVPARTASATMEQSEELEQLLRLLGGLPANQQEVVRLKFQEGMSYKEIAAITGLTVSNVGFLLHTAVKALRERTKQHL